MALNSFVLNSHYGCRLVHLDLCKYSKSHHIYACFGKILDKLVISVKCIP